MQLAKQKIEILARSKQGKTKCLNIYDAINIHPPGQHHCNLFGIFPGRPVVGALPILTIEVTGFAIVLLHRILEMLSFKKKHIAIMIEEKILLIEKEVL